MYSNTLLHYNMNKTSFAKLIIVVSIIIILCLSVIYYFNTSKETLDACPTNLNYNSLLKNIGAVTWDLNQSCTINSDKCKEKCGIQDGNFIHTITPQNTGNPINFTQF